ncbi:MAG: phosphoesterase PA-phosphatase related [Herbaspirillum sp.]|jgi:acid phosphatase (class A)|nr:phosphoesterase PA-phosphatase related [Herbaspirillum sp.]
MKKLTLPLLCLAAFTISSAYARDAAFVSAEQTHMEQYLATPPAADSPTTKAELALLHGLQSTRTPAQIAQAKADDQLETMFIYKNVLGEKFTPENLPVTAVFAARVKNDEPVNGNVPKELFHRVRPYNLDKTLSPVCVTKTKDDSYPSGHTIAGYLAALALVEMVPEKRDAILARADEYAHNRLVCGVHYPTDIEASKMVAYATHAMMDSNPQYRKELAAAKTELRRALSLPVASN